MAAYRRVYDSRHLQADCKEPRSALEPYAWQSNMGYLYLLLHWHCVIEKKSRFTAFLDSNLHTRLAIVTENELGLAFPPRNLSKKFRTDPSTFYLVIVVTDKQTDRQTNAGDYIIPRESFRGDNDDVSF